jgi:hypothetical protein
MLSVTNKPFMLSVIMLNVVMLSVVILNVVILNVVTPACFVKKMFAIPKEDDIN